MRQNETRSAASWESALDAVPARRAGLRALGYVREIVLIVVAYSSYAWVRGQVGAATDAHDTARAVANGENIITIERAIGLAHEDTVQAWALHASWLVRALDSFWSYGYLVVTVAVIVWMMVWHPRRFAPLRTAFFLATMAAVAIFAAVPTAPPRMLPESYHIHDTWITVGGIAARHPPRIEHISDPFASMPSLHVAWSVWCAVAVARVVSSRRVRTLAWAYAALTVIAVLVTGNHYFLDCIAGFALMVVFVWVGDRISAVTAPVGARVRAAWGRRSIAIAPNELIAPVEVD